VVAGFDGGAITSNAGALLVGAADRATGLMGRFASCFEDTRRPDLIEHEVHGLLVAAGDAPALASALERLLSDPPARVRMGEQALERQRREFDLDVMVRTVEDLYGELFEATARARAEGWARPRSHA